MAVAFRSQSTTSFASATTSVVTKPTGLAVGDLMIAQFSVAAGAPTMTPPSGFTLIDTITGGAGRMSKVYSKVADSSDVAATNFTFTIASGAQCSASILAFSGASVPQPVFSSSSASDGTTGSISIPSINTLANTILVLATVTDTIGTPNFSNYAIVTSNPTWTEAYDIAVASTMAYSLAYSNVRSASTATGAGSFTVTASVAGSIGGVLLCIPPDQSISTSDTVTSSEIKTLSLTFNQTDTITSSDTITSRISRAWTKLTRNIKSWTKLDR